MLSRVFGVPSRRRIIRALLVVSVLLSGFAAAPARAGGGGADAGLSGSGIDFTGTRSLVGSVRTAALRAALPGSNARILIVGTGVQKTLFPDALQTAIAGTGLTDGHGFGTVAASTILQLVPGATITSVRVPAFDTSYHLMKVDALAAALEDANASRSKYDLVLLAYPPQAALDPAAHLIGHGDYGRYGRGMNLLIEALLSTPSSVDGTIAAIPADKGLRDRVFARANLKQRDAVERYVTQTKQWNRVMNAVHALDQSGVPIVAPAGDFTRHTGETVQALYPQTTFGLASHPSVITVGAAYAAGGKNIVSPMSGRGPTLALGQKPDLLAPADVMAMLPSNAQVQWPDDSTRVPLQTLQWAKAGVAPSTCPSIQGLYKCVLQGSSMVAASVVAANLATSVATGVPHTTAARAATDDEVLRGFAWSVASRSPARGFEADRAAYPWEEGAGVLGGLKGIDPRALAIPLEPADLGEVGWNEPASRTVTLWPGGAGGAPSARLESLLGPDQTGATLSLPYANTARLTPVSDAGAIRLDAKGGRYQGGFYSGRLTITPAGGTPTSIPATLTQGLPLNFKVSYAYNEYLSAGIEGERVEDATLVLFSSLPTNVGLIGTAFKNLSGKAFQSVGGDPTNNYYLRYGITKNSFTDSSIPASQHGRGVITSVPPGFYRMHLLSDHGVEARQSRGREESLGIRLGSFGPDAAYVPGSNVLVGAQPPCDGGSAPAGPFKEACTTRTGRTIDPNTGFCTAGNSQTAVAFNVYCGEIAYAVPSAVVSRAVHMIEHDATPTKSEWKTCGVDIPLDGKSIDFANLAVNTDDCEGTTMPTQWSFNAKAPGCLASEEKAAFPTGHPTDVTVSYGGASAPGLPGRNFPVAVMNYTFKLPSPNTYTTAGLSLSYVADNAIVGLRFQTGTDSLSDASSSLLVIDDPDVAVTPAMSRGGTKGSAYNEWSVMSANATSGRITMIVIPTAWARTDLDATKPIASVQLCDVALRVNTFGKQSFGRAAVENGKPTQFFPVPDRDLIDQIDPTTSRVRAHYEGGAFKGIGVERESLSLAVQIPKDTTKASGATHRVLSPVGGPAYLVTARRWDGARQEPVLESGFKANDPGYGTSVMDCKDGAAVGETNPDRITSAETCRLVKLARANNQMLTELTPQARYNGRFFGNLALDHATLKRAAGDVAFDIADADDAAAFEKAGHWANASKFEISNFYDDLLPFPLEPLSGIIQIVRDPQGNPVLRVNTYEIGGLTHTITSTLR